MNYDFMDVKYRKNLITMDCEVVKRLMISTKLIISSFN